MIVVDRRVPIALLASPRKSAIGRPSHHAKDRRLAKALVRKAEASRETVVHVYVVIDLRVKGGRILDEFRRPLEIVWRNKAPGTGGIERTGGSGNIRERNLCEDGFSDGADTVRIDKIRHAAEGKLRSTGSVRIARRWVVDGNQCAARICRVAKIPIAKIRGGHGAIEELALMIIDTEEIAKEEGLVLDNGPTDVGPIVVVRARSFRYGGLEERLGRQRADAVDFVSGAVKLVRT